MDKKRLLIVDDEPDIRKVLKKRLEEEGFECLTAQNAEEALKIAKNDKPSLIILDLVLPGKDGFQIYKELKAQNDTKDIPILVYTAQNPEVVVQKGLKALSVVDFVLKPFDSKDLTVLIKRFLSSEKKRPRK